MTDNFPRNNMMYLNTFDVTKKQQHYVEVS